jgi:hypothetical protein
MAAGKRNRRGLALILVLTVVLALAIIATPFVLSMLHQEKTAVTARATSQSDVGAIGAANMTLTQLYRGIDPWERQLGGTPYVDGLQEFQVPINSGQFGTLNVLDITGRLWGFTIHDEQAKLNIESCPTRALDTLRTLVDFRIHDQKDYLTRFSSRDARWILPQRVRAAGTITVGPGQTVEGAIADNVAHYGAGARLRFSRPGMRPFETAVRTNFLYATGLNAVETDPPVPGAYNGGVVEVEARHPVNVCTARREVLIAMWEGLAFNVAGIGSDTVTREEAMTLAAAMYGRTFETFADWALAVAAVNGPSLIDKAAIVLNALSPTIVAISNGTVPVAFVNFDTVAIEGRAMQNSASGTPLGTSGFLEVLDIAPPVPVARSLSSQHDFDHYLSARAMAAGQFGTVFAGYPWGSKMLTYPAVPPNPSDRTWQKPNQAWLQLAPSRDYRGNCQYAQVLQPREHYDTELEGLKLGGGSTSWTWDRVFTTNPNPPPANPLQQSPDCTAGGMEMWIRFDAAPGAGPVQLFDIREADMTNRLSLRYENGQLHFTATDCTVGSPTQPLDKGVAEIRTPFIPAVETWYHIGAYWKGTRYGHLALLVDGFADPAALMKHYDEAGVENFTELSSDLAQAATGISLKDVTWIPDPTTNDPGPVPLLIGSEVVGYDKASGTAIRGMRNTTAAFHPKGTKVSLFGYSAKLQPLQVSVDLGPLGTLTMLFDRLPTVNGAVQYTFGQAPAATVQGDKSNMGMTFIDASQNYVPVNSPAITDFPEKGYIKIDNEVIYYDQIDTSASPPRFASCQRGQHGTTPAQHNTGANVQMWCVPVTNTNNYLSPTIIQIEEEWIGPVQRDPVRPGFFIGVVQSGTVLPLWRGVLGSSQTSHAQSEAVLPLFGARESDMAVNRHNLMRYDRVTLLDATNYREQHRIRRATLGSGPFTFNMGDTQLAGFWAGVAKDFVPDQLHVRVAKWPSGELLGLNWLQTSGPGFSIGAGNFTVDEVKFFGSPKGNFMAAVIVNDTSQVVSVNGAGGLAQQGGALKIGDEIIGYATISGNNLQKCKRGWLNSPAQVHDQGDLAFNMSFLPISRITADIGDLDRTIPLSQALIGQGYTNGYVLIDQEVIGFESQGAQLTMPPDFDGNGLLRGMFGTTPRAHSTDALVYGIPWRYWDGYKPGQWDNRLPYWQASWTVRGARWRAIQWDAELPVGDTNLVVHCQVRCDGVGEIYALPALANDSLTWEFTGDGQAHRIDHASVMREKGQLDARFRIEYRPGSFWPNHSWKRTPRIRSIDVEYDRETKVLFHEDK